MKRWIVLSLFFAVLLASCTGVQMPPIDIDDTSIPATSAPSADMPDTGNIPTVLPPAQLKAVESLAGALGISASEINVIQVEAVEWPDSCLGVQRMNVLCAQGIVPGFRIILEAGGKQYEYHTDQDGSAIVQSALGMINGVNLGEKATIQTLADALGIPPESVQVITNTSVEWPDACLGVVRPGVSCAQAATLGSSIVLEANGVQYEFHTNQDGSVVVPATLALTWHREGGLAGFCDDMYIFLPNQVFTSWCKPQAGSGEANLSQLLSPEEYAIAAEWLAKFGEVNLTIKDPATTDAMTTTLVLHGFGSGQPSESEQAVLFAWAQDLYERTKP